MNERSIPTAVNPAHGIQSVGWVVSHQILAPARLTPNTARLNSSHWREGLDAGSSWFNGVSDNLFVASGMANNVLMNGAVANALNSRTCHSVIAVIATLLVFLTFMVFSSSSGGGTVSVAN